MLGPGAPTEVHSHEHFSHGAVERVWSTWQNNVVIQTSLMVLKSGSRMMTVSALAKCEEAQISTLYGKIPGADQ
jgi:hypothetical protein